MKKLNVLNFVVFAFISILFVGCKSSSPVVSDELTPVKVDKCIELQKQLPERRAWGVGRSSYEQTAKNFAISAAEASFARMLEVAVELGTSNFIQIYGNTSSEDETALSKDFFSVVARQIVKSTKEIDYSPYKQKDGKFYTYVCIEYNGTIDEMAESVTSKVNNQLSDEEKLKIQFDYQQYKKEIEEQLKKMQQK